MNKNNFMPIVEKICSFPPSALDRTEEDGKELLNLCRTLMDMVNIPSNAEIYEIPLMKNNQVVIYFFLENDDEKEYCLNAGHWLDDTISMKLEAYGKETHEYDIEMYTAFESLPLDYFENHEKESENTKVVRLFENKLNNEGSLFLSPSEKRNIGRVGVKAYYGMLEVYKAYSPYTRNVYGVSFTQNEYIKFMYSENNIGNCKHCPENNGGKGLHPCNQPNCWVSCHCNQ